MTNLTRRRVLGASMVTAMAGCIAKLSEAAQPKSTNVSIEAWMNQWMRERGPEGTLHVGRFREPMYFLLKPIGWKPEGDKVGKYPEVTVPKGFVTDFASIPRVFWSLLRPDGDYTYPAIIHDYLYWRQDTPREVADDILKFGMQDFNVDKVTVTAIYTAVRGAGGSSWAANASEKKQGIGRILIKEPDDPRVSWNDWKKRPDVFGPDQ
jgi:hypothetical protein